MLTTELTNKYGGTYNPIIPSSTESIVSNPYKSITDKYGGTFTPAITSTPNFATDWLGIKNPNTYVQDALSQIGDTIMHPIKAIKNTVGAAVDSIMGTFGNAYTATKEVFTGENETVAKKTADLLYAIGADAAVAFAAINAAFSAASQLPVLKEAADLLQMPFAVTGKIGEFASEKFIDALPIDQESKDIIRPAFGQVGALAGQVLLGGKLMSIIVRGGILDRVKVDEMVKDTQTKVGIAKQEALKNQQTLPELTVTPETKSTLEPLAQEARKFSSAEDFRQSVRLKSIQRQDIETLAKAKKDPAHLEFMRGGDTKITEQELKSVNEELAKLPENKLWEQTIKLLPGEGGWFKRAEDFYNQATKGITPLQEGGIAQAKASGQSFDEWVKGQETNLGGKAKSTLQSAETGKPIIVLVSRGAISGEKLSEGAFLSSAKDVSQFYGARAKQLSGKIAENMPAIVDLKNPLVVNDKISLFNKIDGNENFLLKAEVMHDYRSIDEVLLKYGKENGYDGIIFKKTSFAGTNELVNVPEMMIIDTKKVKTRSLLKAEWDGVGEAVKGGGIEPPTPQIAVNKAGYDLLRNAVEERLLKKTGEIPTHERTNLVERGNKATEFVIKEPKLAEDIAFNKTDIPANSKFFKSDVYEAVEAKAILESNVDLIERLSKSTLPTEAGQELVGYKGFDELNPIDRIKEVQIFKANKSTKINEIKVERIVKDATKEMNKTNLPKETLLQKLSDFIDKNICP